MGKVISILSSRPELIRQSLILKKLDSLIGTEHTIIYTGQNYDKNLYSIVLKDLCLRTPDYIFNIVEKLNNYDFIGSCMNNIEIILTKYNTSNTVINLLGDVNGAFASAFVAKRMGFRIYHNESGNRAGKDILEEINRKCVDSMAYKLLCYSQRSRENLLFEGYNPRDIIVTGNPLGEVVKTYFDISVPREIKQPYILMTLHRHETINSYSKLQSVTNALKVLSKKYTIILSTHPSLAAKLNNKNIESLFEDKGILLCEPLKYSKFLSLMYYSDLIISDSGGECEEAAMLNTKCVVIRDETERTELLEVSQMVLCGTGTKDILRGVDTVLKLELEGIPTEYLKPTSSIVTKLLLSK
ncbi:hypothetical protein LCGC14_0306180 [marine sediment metagenome]|uniref:UDP-N-acetylglucosamine 2-epimerase domain-containing protein n=1 Tax=marine sediment metagenome TaxID=412755 RepID=A0A0F9TU02_9ZZZZ